MDSIKSGLDTVWLVALEKQRAEQGSGSMSSNFPGEDAQHDDDSYASL